MPRLSETAPYVHPDCQIGNSTFGRFVEIGQGSRVLNSSFDDYSYCDRYVDIANATIGKFANIASFTRIGPTDHPMGQASLHHFLYRSSDYWDDVENDADFFARRAARRSEIGHDTWIGHGAIIRPEVRIGHGAVVGAGAVVTRDVPDYHIVTGVPATPMRARFPEDIAQRLLALAWWDWSHDVLKERLPDFRAMPIEAFLEKYEA
ncbi:chloramphenicol acetyltransferase [Pseudoprimorskyibacter insulae]|uniref:Chloramphenicol acetyltransferase n=1 Tax=Pseudoprimorskyibacter insulae TaxID=1695997 RepID=A0A2R8AN05_9RHOB|nr:chloramphenicol acetyltransferase [Pseudoprimorskyibacter insulae]SPF77425.1 Chloramphenicol acetyltransferase [Pseudoprimorskyibacter insulae]